MELQKRKPNRLSDYDYSRGGYYFITICTAEKQKILCNFVGCGVLDAPKTELSAIGKTVENRLTVMKDFYKEIKIDKYVIMPNHIHLIIKICNDNNSAENENQRCVGDAAPYNNVLSNFIGTFKRFTNKTANRNLWQTSFYDHIIRDEKDYLRIWEYIENNPAKWNEDKYYTE